MKYSSAPTIIISACLILGAFSVLILKKINKVPNYNGGFQRSFNNDLLSERRVLDIRYNSYYIAGSSDSRIYLGNTTAPYHLLSVSQNLEDTTFLSITVPQIGKLARPALQIRIIHPFVFASETLTPAVLKGSVDSLKLHFTGLDTRSFQSTPVFISPNSIIVKTYDRASNKSILSKIYDLGREPEIQPNALEQQIDGMFCTDGFMIHENNSPLLAYVYYYRNQFICMDTTMKIMYRGHTIDTITKAHIKVDTIHSENTRTLSAPPIIVNKKGVMTSDKILIQSSIRSDTETSDMFNENSVIDIYSVHKGTYLYSVSIPYLNGKEPHSFSVIGNNLVLLQDNFLISYKLTWQ